MSLGALTLFAVFCLASVIPGAEAADPSLSYRVEIIRESDSPKISGLKIDDSPQILHLEEPSPGGGRPLPALRLSGEFTRKNWSLILTADGKPIELGRLQTISVVIPLSREITVLQFTAISSNGTIEREKITIRAMEAHESQAGTTRPSITTSLGVASVQYLETHVPDYAMLASTIKVAWRYRISSDWNLEIDSFMNLFPISASRRDVTVRFLGANLRAGYLIPWVESPWSLGIQLGAAFSHMSVTGGLFGYNYLISPEVYPSVTRSFGKSLVMFSYLKYVPLNSGLGLSTVDLEFSTGLGLKRILENGHPWSFTVNYSDFQFHQSEGHLIHSTIVGFDVGYGW